MLASEISTKSQSLFPLKFITTQTQPSTKSFTICSSIFQRPLSAVQCTICSNSLVPGGPASVPIFYVAEIAKLEKFERFSVLTSDTVALKKEVITPVTSITQQRRKQNYIYIFISLVSCYNICKRHQTTRSTWTQSLGPIFAIWFNMFWISVLVSSTNLFSVFVLIPLFLWT